MKRLFVLMLALMLLVPAALAEGAWDRTSLELAWSWGLLPEDAGAGITRAQGAAMADRLQALL